MSFLVFTATPDDGARAWGGIGGIGLAAFIIYQMLLRAYHVGLTPASELLETDRRPPILYLRSFLDDGKNNLHPLSEAAELFGLKNQRGVGSGTGVYLLPALKLFCYVLRIGKVINLFRGIRTRTAEEEFAVFFRTRGPFIAIGRPGEKLAEGGAARLYVGHDVWQQKVSELLPRCQAVVLQPEETEGVWWEIVQLVQAVPPEKVLFCLVNYAGNQQRYEEFRIKFEDMTGIGLPRMIGRYMFLYFGSRWAPHLIESRYRSEFTWPWLGEAIDFNRTLGPFFDHKIPPPFSEKDRRFSGLGWLAVTTYFILSVLLLLGVPLSVALLARHFGGTP